MPTRDDEQFESYLKQFRPVAPEALPTTTPMRKSRGVWRISALIATAAVIIMLVIVVTRNLHEPMGANIPVKDAGPRHIAAEAPFTMRNANKLLADAPSFKSAVDDLAFKSQKTPLAKNEQSAVYMLGKEKFKL